MQKHSSYTRWLGLWSLALLASVNSVRSAEMGDKGIYFRGGIGPALAHETDVKEFLGPSSGLKVKYDPGVRVSVAGG